MIIKNFVKHYIMPTSLEEVCGMCLREYNIRTAASHKVGEEFHFDDNISRHNLTQYVCCRHFGLIMGPLAKEWCGLQE